MPWHDVSIRVDGAIARDIARNFIQRWNHHKEDLSSTPITGFGKVPSPLEPQAS